MNTTPIVHGYGTLLKSLPDQFTKGPNEEWALASVEVPDRDGDIIRVKGIDLSMHRPECPIKVIGATASHLKHLKDGEVPVMGIVKEFAQTTYMVKGMPVPALAFKYAYATDAEGALTEYAKQQKSLFDAGTLDSFSGRFRASDIKPLTKGRYDVRACALDGEISACVLSVNPYTTILKAVEQVLGDDFDKLAYLEERLVLLQKSIDALNSAMTEQDATNQVIELIKGYTKRFDVIEAAVVAASEGPAKQTSDRQPSQLDPAQVQRAIRLIQEAANRL